MAAELKVSQIKPLRSQTLVKWIPNYETDSGIALPKTESFNYVKGEIVATGPDCKEVKVGDKVYIEKYAAHEKLWLEGYHYALIDEMYFLACFSQ